MESVTCITIESLAPVTNKHDGAIAPLTIHRLNQASLATAIMAVPAIQRSNVA